VNVREDGQQHVSSLRYRPRLRRMTDINNMRQPWSLFHLAGTLASPATICYSAA
jgi:hypothetical protein